MIQQNWYSLKRCGESSAVKLMSVLDVAVDFDSCPECSQEVHPLISRYINFLLSTLVFFFPQVLLGQTEQCTQLISEIEDDMRMFSLVPGDRQMDTPSRVLGALNFLQRSFAWNISGVLAVRGWCILWAISRYVLQAVCRQSRAFES